MKAILAGQWQKTEIVQKSSYLCGHCGKEVGPNHGFRCNDVSRGLPIAKILICPTCNRPTFLFGDEQVPGAPYGEIVPDITNLELRGLYEEARNCASVMAYTASVMACRKILMNIAVHHGATAGQSFVHYVDFLEQSNFVPPTGRNWVDAIRKLGNAATHEIQLMAKEDAELAIRFTEMLLRFIYEMPAILSRAKRK